MIDVELMPEPAPSRARSGDSTAVLEAPPEACSAPPEEEPEDDAGEETPRPRKRRKKRKKKRADSYAMESARRQASAILFTVAGLNLVCGGILVALAAPLVAKNEPGKMPQLYAEWIGPTVAFVGLGIWALFRPLVPSILGLFLYLVLTMYTFASLPAIGVQLVFIVGIRLAIIVALGKAASAAWTAR